jgi:hypothetical protein
MLYKSKYNRNASEKKNKVCARCAAIKRTQTYGSPIIKLNKEVSDGIRLNGFANKKHKIESIEKMKKSDKSYTQTPLFKRKCKVFRGTENGMFGKSFYDIWVAKFGIEVANQKLLEHKDRLSKLAIGEKNSMYGKPTPNGSGNGWSGWYKGWFFRSLLELSYMINVIERFNLKWQSAEKSEYRIKYMGLGGQNRTYMCDFVIANKYLVEIKPKALHNSKIVKSKSNSAIQFCKNNGLKYKITECRKLTHKELKFLIDNKKIILTERYKVKYDEQYKKL